MEQNEFHRLTLTRNHYFFGCYDKAACCPNGQAVSFGSIHEGFRGICEWDFAAWLRRAGEEAE